MSQVPERSSAVGVSPEARSGAGLEALTLTAERSGPRVSVYGVRN